MSASKKIILPEKSEIGLLLSYSSKRNFKAGTEKNMSKSEHSPELILQ